MKNEDGVVQTIILYIIILTQLILILIIKLASTPPHSGAWCIACEIMNEVASSIFIHFCYLLLLNLVTSISFSCSPSSWVISTLLILPFLSHGFLPLSVSCVSQALVFLFYDYGLVFMRRYCLLCLFLTDFTCF